MLKCVTGEISEHIQGLVIVLQLQYSFFINSLHIFLRLQLYYGLKMERNINMKHNKQLWFICSDIPNAVLIQYNIQFCLKSL